MCIRVSVCKYFSHKDTEAQFDCVKVEYYLSLPNELRVKLSLKNALFYLLLAA
jgi:hypothetical protein